MFGRPLSAFCAVALSCAPYISMAADFNVDSAGAFQNALTTAQANGESDTITVAAGTLNIAANGTLTYTAAATENFGLTVTGGAQALAVLDGGMQVPILRIDSTAVTNDSGVYFEVENLTFRNGNATSVPNDDGGALTILTDENQQPAEFASLVSVVGSEFFDNAAADDGGALYVRAHAVEGIYLDDLTFDGNQAGGDGGSAYVAGGVFTTPIFFNNIDFYDGMAQGNGGGLVVEGFDSATETEDRANSVSFFDIAFYNNQSMSSSGGGGGADVSSLATTIDTVGFIDNQARDGGGLRIRQNWSSISMKNTGFVGNTASEDGGAFAAMASFFQAFTMTNNTIVDNVATNRGGGAFVLIDSSSSLAEIYNNIIYGNAAQQGSGDDLYVNNRAFDDIGASVELFNNDITDFVVTPVAVVQGSNIDELPLFVDLVTRPIPDPRLQSGSPGIDTGDNNAPGAPTVDFEGDSRPFDGDGDMTATIDMGMDEFTGAAVQNADLAVTKTDDPDPVVEGGDVTYTVTVTNNGPGAASNVTLIDTIDELVSFVSATPTQGTCSANMGTISCSLGSLANSATATITIIVTTPDVAEPLQITNQASVSGAEPDPVGANDSATEQTTVVPAGPAMADLSLSKSDSPDPVFSDGSTLTYTLIVTNNGPDAASGVTLTDTLPASVTFQSASASVGQCDELPDNNGELGCDLGSLAVNATVTVMIVVVPDMVDDEVIITNTATVVGTEQDPTSANNTATEDTTVNPPTADMIVSTSSTPSSPMINETVTYSVTVQNNGPSDNTGVVLTVMLPASATFGSVTIDQGSCDVVDDTVTCTIGDIAAGSTVNATIIVTAPGEPMVLTLSATIAADADDPSMTNNADSEDVIVIDVVDVVIRGTSEGTGSLNWVSLAFLIAMACLIAIRNRRRLATNRGARTLGLLAILSVGLLLSSGEVRAQSDWYVGANIGQAGLDYSAGDLTQDLASLGWDINNPSVNDSGTAWKAYGGFMLNEYFALEAGYADLGKVVTQYGATIAPTQIPAILGDTFSIHPYQGDGWFGAAVLRWPVQPDRFTILFRAGMFGWESDLDVRVISGGTGSITDRESGMDTMFGAGLEWHVNQEWTLVAEWERYKLNEWLDVPSIGIRFSF